jgi:hypothetical protein
VLPGTAAVVVLGDAFTGNVSPMLALVSVGTAALGVAGLVYEIRKHRRESAAGEADEDIDEDIDDGTQQIDTGTLPR